MLVAREEGVEGVLELLVDGLLVVLLHLGPAARAAEQAGLEAAAQAGQAHVVPAGGGHLRKELKRQKDQYTKLRRHNHYLPAGRQGPGRCCSRTPLPPCPSSPSYVYSCPPSPPATASCSACPC